MKKYLILYCIYDPERFHGYYKVIIEASDHDMAEQHIRGLIDKRGVLSPYEYNIYEISTDYGPKLHEKQK